MSGSDYHKNGKHYSKRNVYREKFPKGKDWKEPEPNPFQEGASRISPDAYHGMEVIAVDIKKYNQLKAKADKLDRDLEYSRGQLETVNKYWDKIRVERNTYLLEKEMLEKQVKELETKLYFCNRNRRLENIIGSADTVSEKE
jgi:hypothetical protein